MTGNPKSADKTMLFADLPITLQETLTKIINNEGYIHYDSEIQVISTDGANFSGLLYEVRIKGNSAKGYQETNLFVKEAFDCDKIKLGSGEKVYLNEAFVYNELSHIFDQLQNDACIPETERFKIAKSYDCNKKFIILENLANRGFRTLHRMDAMPLKLAELSVKQLARFHALSFVIGKKMPSFHESKIKTRPTQQEYGDEWRGFFSRICDKIVETLRPDEQERIKKFIPVAFEKYSQYMKDRPSFSTLCHTDYKISNLMVREVNGEICEVIPVDYQLVHYGCPVTDFLYLIFCNTDQDLRRNHLEYLKCLYCDTLDNFLNYFGMDSELILSRALFEKTYNEKLEFGLMAGMYLAFFNFRCGEVMPDIKYKALLEISFSPDPRLKERMRGLVNDYINWGYL